MAEAAKAGLCSFKDAVEGCRLNSVSLPPPLFFKNEARRPSKSNGFNSLQAPRQEKKGGKTRAAAKTAAKASRARQAPPRKEPNHPLFVSAKSQDMSTETWSRQAIMAAHGVTCGIAVALLVPLLSFIGRYGRCVRKRQTRQATFGADSFPRSPVSSFFIQTRRTRWFIHGIFSTLTLALMIAGVALGMLHRNPGPHFIAAHGVIGLMMPILVLLQYIMGIYIYKAYDASAKSRPLRNQVHRITGPIIIIFGFVDCVLGFIRWPQILPNDTQAATISFWVFVGFTAVSYAVLIYIGERLKTRYEKMQNRNGFETTWKVAPATDTKGDEKGILAIAEKVPASEVVEKTATLERPVEWTDVVNAQTAATA